MHSLTNHSNAQITGDKLNDGKIIQLSETIVSASCSIHSSGYIQGTFLHEGDSRAWLIKITEKSDPVLELPKQTRVLDTVQSASGHTTVISAIPRDAYGEDSTDETKTIALLPDSFRSTVEVPDDASVLLSSN